MVRLLSVIECCWLTLRVSVSFSESFSPSLKVGAARKTSVAPALGERSPGWRVPEMKKGPFFVFSSDFRHLGWVDGVRPHVPLQSELGTPPPRRQTAPAGAGRVGRLEPFGARGAQWWPAFGVHESHWTVDVAFLERRHQDFNGLFSPARCSLGAPTCVASEALANDAGAEQLPSAKWRVTARLSFKQQERTGLNNGGQRPWAALNASSFRSQFEKNRFNFK